MKLKFIIVIEKIIITNNIRLRVGLIGLIRLNRYRINLIHLDS